MERLRKFVLCTEYCASRNNTCK